MCILAVNWAFTADVDGEDGMNLRLDVQCQHKRRNSVTHILVLDEAFQRKLLLPYEQGPDPILGDQGYSRSD